MSREELRGIALGGLGTLVLLLCCAAKRPPKVVVWVDPNFGCHYLSNADRSVYVPRLNLWGRHVCEAPKQPLAVPMPVNKAPDQSAF